LSKSTAREQTRLNEQQQRRNLAEDAEA
jgi:hypothetical protein